jgi:D-alanyl-D-alanine carboxypeptidase (penicillin-binding protein 5/6)
LGDYQSEEELYEARRQRRRAEMRRRRRQRERRKKILLMSLLVFLLILCGFGIGRIRKNTQAEDIPETIETQNEEAGEEEMAEELSLDTEEMPAVEDEPEEETNPETEIPFASGYTFSSTESTAALNGDVLSTYGILIDLDTNTIVAQRNAKDRINPASMTKILTVLVAAEHITDLDDTFTITREITDFSYQNDCSSVGFAEGETVTVKDLLYGTILPSGGDAAAGLAYYVAGSLDEFAELLNEKIAELGLSGSSHFTNCVGLYDENHYSTVYDMGVMLKAAVENELCREVLSAHTYTTSSTTEHPEGITVSNWFLRRIEDKETNGEVVCAKTGYVVQSGNCAASYSISNEGKHYICVTADTYSSWRAIYDHVAVYQQYCK